MKLHISPIEMQKMYWYDISYLYKRYEKYVEDKNEETTVETGKQEDFVNNYTKDIRNMQNSFNTDNITRGFNGNLPNF